MGVDVGASREAIRLLGNINQRLYHPTKIFIRFTGYFLVVFVIYLNLFMHTLENRIYWWIFLYLGYVLLLELIRWRAKKYYDRSFFRIFRILLSTIFTSWLVAISPLTRQVLVFYFLLPLLSGTVYFRHSKPAIITTYLASIAGLYLGGIGFALAPPLSYFHFITISIILVVFGYFLWKLYTTALNDPVNLAEFGNQLHRIRNIHEILEKTGETCKKLCASELMIIIVVDPEYNRYLSHYLMGFKLKSGKNIETLSTRCAVLQSGTPFQTPDIKAKGFSDGSIYDEFFTTSPRAIVAEPIYGKDENILGVISVCSESPNFFNQQTIDTLRQLSYIVSSAVENCINYRKIKLGRIGEEDISTKLSIATNEDQAITFLMEEAMLLDHADDCVYHEYQSVNESLVSRRIFSKEGAGNYSPVHPGRKMCFGEGIAGKTIELREPLRVPSVFEHPWFETFGDDPKFTSLLVAPLLDPLTHNPVGTISVCSTKENAFSVSDEFTLFALAAQGARQISNLREFSTWRLQGGSIKRIFDEFRNFDIYLSEDQLCLEITRAAVKTLGFGMARIRTYDKNTDELETVAITGVPEDITKKLIGERMPFPVLVPFLTEKYQAGDSYLIPNNDPQWQEVADQFFYIPPGSTSNRTGWDAYDAYISVIRNQFGELLGILTLDQPASGRPTPQEIETVDVFAKAASWVLERADSRRGLLEKQERLMAFIKSISDAPTGKLGIQGFGELVVKIGATLFSAEGCTLHLVEDEDIVLTHSNYLKGTEFINTSAPISDKEKSGLTSYVAATRESLVYNNGEFRDHPAWAGLKAHLSHLPSKSCYSLLKVPIISEKTGAVQGVLTLENKKRFGRIVDFDREDVERLQILASEVSMALDVISEYKKIQRWELASYEDDLHELMNWYHSGVYLYLESLDTWIQRGDLDKVKEEIPSLKKRAWTAVDEMKALHTAITRKYLEEENFITAIHLLVEAWIDRYRHMVRDDSPLNISIHCQEDVRLPTPLKNILLRITSSAISNALKHSGVLYNPEVKISVEVKRIGNKVVLQVTDTGQGMDEVKPGYGLTRIQQLAGILTNKEKIRTDLKIKSKIGEGTKIKVTAYL